MSDTIKVNIVRPTHLRGQRIETGRFLHLQPLDAHALVTNGKAVLANATDADRMYEAVRRADTAAVSGARGYMPTVQGPW